MKTFKEKLAELSAHERAEFESELEALRKTLPLSALRKLFARSQAFVASKLGISQAAVSQLEGRGDVLLSTFFDYVHALGGRPSLRVDAPGVRVCVNGERYLDSWVFTVDTRDRATAHSDDSGYRSIGVLPFSHQAIAANEDRVILRHRRVSPSPQIEYRVANG